MSTRSRSQRAMVERHRSGSVERDRDELVVEEPLEIRFGGVTVATTMRTPDHDFELAVGFCAAEGLIGDGPVASVRYCATGPAAESAFNVVTVDARPGPVEARERVGAVTSSCGWCGSEVVAGLARRLPVVRATDVRAEVLESLDSATRSTQSLFALTGGSHAAAAFDLGDGSVVALREDIGRHNAVDKVVGRLRLDGSVSPSPLGLWVSGRASFEIVQKAWAAGFPVVVTVSAASALAVETAERGGLTLVGFARGGDRVVYTGRVR